MNKKGFTTIELLLTILIVLTIMASITSVTYSYRDRGKYEEIISEVTDYKNMVTKIIYDDILDNTNPVVELTKVNNKNFILRRKNNTTINLQIIDETINGVTKKGIKYNNVEYIIPGSNDKYITFEGTTMYPNDYVDRDNTGLYSLDIVFSHKKLEDSFKIHFVIKAYTT